MLISILRGDRCFDIMYGSHFLSKKCLVELDLERELDQVIDKKISFSQSLGLGTNRPRPWSQVLGWTYT